ncbi:MAG: DUF167 domain-containing protein [Nanoarchaeota archaeon]|nr:DUF167 domain-containing protein [Nanoarchaeota archaeon]
MKLQIRVQPNSSKQTIQIDIDGKIQKVFLKNPAKDNKANQELEKLLSKHFKAKTTIIKGHTSKIKTIEVIK